MTDHLKGILYAVLTALCWGVLAIFLKVSTGFSDSGSIVWFRFGFAFVFLFSILCLKKNSPLLEIKKSFPFLAVASGVSLGANYFGFMKGIELTTPANAQIIIQLAPLGLVMCGMLLFKENFKTIQKWGLFIAVLGFGLFFKDQISNLNEGISTYLQGNLWLIFAAITWIIYAVIHKKATQRWSPQVLNLVMYGVAFIVLSPLFTINTFSSLESGEWLIFCFLGFNTVIAYGALAEALKLIPSSLVGIIVSVNPLLTLVLMEILKSQKVSWIAYESIGFVGYLGAFFVVIGAVTVVRNSAEEP